MPKLESLPERLQTSVTMRGLGVPRHSLMSRYGIADFPSFFEYCQFLGLLISRMGCPNRVEGCAFTFEPVHGLSDNEMQEILTKILPSNVDEKEIRKLGLLPVRQSLLRDYLPLSHWNNQCFDQVPDAQFILCDPYYCSVLFQKDGRWRQPPIALDWLVSRESRWPKELVDDYWSNPAAILNEGASLAATFLGDILDKKQLKATSEGEIPEIMVRSQTHLQDLAGALRSLVRDGPKLVPWYRGQNREYLMPDANELVTKGFFLHREFRDPSLLPRAYREIDLIYGNANALKHFIWEIMRWYDLGDDVADAGGTRLEPYGSPSQFLSLTRSINIGWWFATHTYIGDMPRSLFEVLEWEGKSESQWPCVYVFLLSSADHPIVDSTLPAGQPAPLRLQRQECGVLGNAGMLLRNGCARHISLRLRLHPDVGPNRTTDERYLFPSIREDSFLEQLVPAAINFKVFPIYYLE